MSSRRPLIAGNWKMYKTNPEAVQAAQAIKELTADVTDVDIMIAPAFTALAPVAEAIKGSPIGLGAQNLYWEPEGAYTGEVAPQMLASAGCSHVIIGHSERRQYFGETDETVNKKIRSAIANRLIPVFCIGENEQQREDGRTFSVLDKQIENGIKGFSSNELSTLIVAYEPIWAIGTGKTATQEQAQEVHAHVRNWFLQAFGEIYSFRLRILYGGSVKPANVKELMAMPDVDGALVGGASLDPESFSKLVHFQS